MAGAVVAGAIARPGQVRPILVHEPDHVRQGWIIAQFAVFITRDAVDLANRREQFRLFYGVDTEVGLEIEIQVQHVFRIAGLLHH